MELVTHATCPSCVKAESKRMRVPPLDPKSSCGPGASLGEVKNNFSVQTCPFKVHTKSNFVYIVSDKTKLILFICDKFK